jgi:hypothetical protein
MAALQWSVVQIIGPTSDQPSRTRSHYGTRRGYLYGIDHGEVRIAIATATASTLNKSQSHKAINVVKVVHYIKRNKSFIMKDLRSGRDSIYVRRKQDRVFKGFLQVCSVLSVMRNDGIARDLAASFHKNLSKFQDHFFFRFVLERKISKCTERTNP